MQTPGKLQLLKGEALSCPLCLTELGHMCSILLLTQAARVLRGCSYLMSFQFHTNAARWCKRLMDEECVILSAFNGNPFPGLLLSDHSSRLPTFVSMPA